MHPVPTIRPATAADAPELARLRWDASAEDTAIHPETFPRFLATFREFWLAAMESGRWSVWVAEQDGRLIGNVWVERVGKVPRPWASSSEYGYVTNVYVEPEWRSRGMGGTLVEEAVRQAREQGLEFLIVWPSEASIPFYERAGFRRSPDAMEFHLDAESVGRLPGPIDRTEDELC